MTLEFAFGGPDGPADGLLGAGLPLLGGAARETLLENARPLGGEPGLLLWGEGDRLAGIGRSNEGEPLEVATARIYGELLGATRGLNLYRIWNFVPDINGAAAEGIENYQAFCRARSLAFERARGPAFPAGLPAASAVGTADPRLTVVFLAGARVAHHRENPVQVPAYRYPPRHGPRPPSFARATVVGGSGPIEAYVSGTSSVVGHETVSPRDTAAQLSCTFENLRRISAACGLGDRLGDGEACRRHFKVYLRHPEDLALAARELGESGLLRPGDRVSYLGAEICRAELNVEIEVAVSGAERS